MKLEYPRKERKIFASSWDDEMVKPEGLSEDLLHSQLSIPGHRMMPKTLEPIHIFMSEAQE